MSTCSAHFMDQANFFHPWLGRNFYLHAWFPFSENNIISRQKLETTWFYIRKLILWRRRKLWLQSLKTRDEREAIKPGWSKQKQGLKSSHAKCYCLIFWVGDFLISSKLHRAVCMSLFADWRQPTDRILDNKKGFLSFLQCIPRH